MSKQDSFADLLEAVDKLADEDQEAFVEILERRRIARRRASLARDVAEARREHAGGQTAPRTVEEIVCECLN